MSIPEPAEHPVDLTAEMLRVFDLTKDDIRSCPFVAHAGSVYMLDEGWASDDGTLNPPFRHVPVSQNVCGVEVAGLTISRVGIASDGYAYCTLWTRDAGGVLRTLLFTGDGTEADGATVALDPGTSRPDSTTDDIWETVRDFLPVTIDGHDCQPKLPEDFAAVLIEPEVDEGEEVEPGDYRLLLIGWPGPESR